MESTSNHKTKSIQAWLQAELVERCRKNPRYSLRSFAASLDMDASSLLKIISGKRSPSAKTIEKICDRLSCSPTQRDHFLKKSKVKKVIEPTLSKEDFHLMAEDAYECMTHWYYSAILELTYVENFTDDPKWIARSLGITVTEVNIAIERLKRLGLVSDAEGKLVKTHRSLTNFVPGLSTSSHREYQRQIISKAVTAIDESGPEEKDITSMTMAIDESKLPEARKIIAKFRRELCAYLEDGTQSRVFNLAIQLYPISKQENSYEN